MVMQANQIVRGGEWVRAVTDNSYLEHQHETEVSEAVNLIFEKVMSLSQENRADLYDLFQELPASEDIEELMKIQKTIIEILTQKNKIV